MFTENYYHNADGQGNELRNWSQEKLAADPTGADLYQGRIWFNSTDGVLKYFDGTTVHTLPTAADLTSIADYQGGHDASTGLPTTTQDGSPIVGGDYWIVTVGGTIAGIGGDDNLSVGDLIVANTDGASTAAEFDAFQTNLNLASNIAQVEEVTIASIPANTPTAIPTTFTNVHSIETYNSADERIHLSQSGPTTAPMLQASAALTNVKVRVVGV